ncbi:zinc finger protein BALDIBIS-like [Salvia splendens]|uniref:zinc finger protein BALDIBIS-like n=1 Tax=Salvia splendens TaxID=180675 RepID=UPI001C2650D5|nr:zinc finger protein BALDIBIS-like [Salvia splendens]
MMSEDGLMRGYIGQDPSPNINSNPNPNSSSKRKRNLPGTPDPDAEVIALSPKSLMATNRFLCEICNKGFQRDQNLQLHRRGHNLPWKLKQRTNKEVKKKVYICPEKTCVHHEASRALGDLTGIKKHYSRKHGEKKWKCDKCSKKYAVQSDWKAHSKICGTREYKCDCGTLFSRKDSFITHRAFCDALAEESARFSSPVASANLSFRNELLSSSGNPQFSGGMFRAELGGVEGGNQLSFDHNNMQKPRLPLWLDSATPNNFVAATSLPELVQMASQNHQWQVQADHNQVGFGGASINSMASSSSAIPIPKVLKEEEQNKGNLSQAINSLYYNHNHNETNNAAAAAAHMSMSATALLQKAAQMGSTRATDSSFSPAGFGLITNASFSAGNFNSSVAQNPTNLGKPENNLNGMMAAESSLTRDFLGVGGNDQIQNRQFMPENELAKFAAGMEMSHYSRN